MSIGWCFKSLLAVALFSSFTAVSNGFAPEVLLAGAAILFGDMSYLGKVFIGTVPEGGKDNILVGELGAR